MIWIIRLRLLILAVLIILAMPGCTKNDWDKKAQDEKSLIQTYVKDHGITEDQKTENGIYFIENVAGTGLSPQKNDYVIINYTGWYIDDGTVHETSYDSLKNEWPNAVTYVDFVFGPLKFQYGFSIAGINEGLSLMKEGGKASLLIPSDKAFYDFRPMLYDIELLKVIPDPIAYEDSVLKEYLAQIGWDTISTRYKDIYIKETFTPDAADIHTFRAGDTLLFRFKAKIVDGFGPVVKARRVFDSDSLDENPSRYVFGQPAISSGHMLAMPQGLKNALDTLRLGTHATFILPFDQAFGDKGLFFPKYGYTIVPKYQTVEYTIEVEDLRSPLK